MACNEKVLGPTGFSKSATMPAMYDPACPVSPEVLQYVQPCSLVLKTLTMHKVLLTAHGGQHRVLCL